MPSPWRPSNMLKTRASSCAPWAPRDCSAKSTYAMHEAPRLRKRRDRMRTGSKGQPSGTAAKCRYCCKSRFALVCKNSQGRRRGFRVKMRGTSFARVILTGDFGRANEAIRIGYYFPPRVFAKNWSLCNSRLLQQNRHEADDPECPRNGRSRG